MSNSLQPHESQHTRPPCPSPTPRVHPDSHPSSQWCHPAISSSVVAFSSCPNPSQQQSLFQWVNSSHEVAKVLEFQLYHHPFQRNPRADLLQNGLVGNPLENVKYRLKDKKKIIKTTSTQFKYQVCYGTMVQLNPFTIRYSCHDTGLNVCVYRKSYFKASLPNVMVFEGWNLGLDEVIGVEPPWLDRCPYKGMKGFVFTQPCEGTRKRVLTRTSLCWHPDHGFSNL